MKRGGRGEPQLSRCTWMMISWYWDDKDKQTQEMGVCQGLPRTNWNNFESDMLSNLTSNFKGVTDNGITIQCVVIVKPSLRMQTHNSMDGEIVELLCGWRVFWYLRCRCGKDQCVTMRMVFAGAKCKGWWCRQGSWLRSVLQFLSGWLILQD